MTPNTPGAQPPVRRRRRPRRALSLAGVSGVLLLLWAYHCVDSAPPEDADLRTPVETAPDDEVNGFVLLGQAAAAIEWPDGPEHLVAGDDEAGGDGDEPVTPPEEQLEEFAYGRGWDQQLVQTTLASNGPQLVSLDRAIDAETFVGERVTEAEQDVLRGWKGLRQAYVLASLRVGERHAAGDDPAALGEALKLVKLGRRLEEVGGPLIRYLLGLAFSDMARGRLLRLTAEARLEAADCKEAVRELERQEPRRDVLRRTFLAEYAYACLLIDATAAGEVPPDAGDLSVGGAAPGPVWPWSSRRFLLPNHSKRLLGSLCREALKAELPAGRFVDVPWDDFLALAPNPWLPGRNGIGRHAVSSCVGSYRATVERHQRGRLGRDFLRLALALKGFQAAHARLPGKLDELVPEWLPAVPLDPFDGQPLRYNRSRRVLWSVGQDRKDAGGIVEPDPEDNELDLDEPTLKLPFG